MEVVISGQEDDKPIRLKKPPKKINWFRNGRWHKVYPRPGRTMFHRGDLCQFKPDLLDVEIVDALHTSVPEVFLYRVRVKGSGHEFSTFGSDLILLKRYKPSFTRWKPKIKFKAREKPKLKLKPMLRLLHYEIDRRKPKFIKPEKGVIARLSFWVEWGPWGPCWVFMDFTDEKELEKEFWKRVEEKRQRFYRRGAENFRYGAFPETGQALKYPCNTDRRGHPEWVCVEWFKAELQYKHQSKEWKKEAESAKNAEGDVHVSPPRDATELRDRPETPVSGGVVQGEVKGNDSGPVRKGRSKPGGHRPRKKAKAASRNAGRKRGKK
jgi:hypothetical protein